jgi:two-component system response regulator AtoC
MAHAVQAFPQRAVNQPIAPEVLFGVTAEMQRVRHTIERVASVRVPVLVRGESGTGKEAVASYLHRISPWSDAPLVKVNCAAIPGALLESELFGYEKGAFTGANAARAGKFELAGEGTVILDEIVDIEPDLQAKLLQVLQDGCFTRVGGLEERTAGARTVCVTNREIEKEIERGDFREDLYYRINVVNVCVPPLRERLEDLPLLVDHFLYRYATLYGRRPQPVPSAVMEFFAQHTWPGNIRELENYVRRYVILESPDTILAEVEDLASAVGQRQSAGNGFQLPYPDDFSLKKYSKIASQQAEQFLITEALKRTRWNRRRTAEMLGISYRALLYKIKEAGLPQKRRNS